MPNRRSYLWTFPGTEPKYDMRRYYIIAGFFIALLCLRTAHSQTTDTKTEPDYKAVIEKFRVDFFAQFLDKEYSPIRTDKNLARLRFYEPDTKFRIAGKFAETGKGEKEVKIMTTHGGVAPFLRYGWLTFEFAGAEHKLAVYKRDYNGPDFFFIPFKDQTNGKTTYGGGRYLGFKLGEVVDGRVVIDFNKAYNPWCHYNEKLACPLPPRENSLRIAVHAGEKIYGKAEEKAE